MELSLYTEGTLSFSVPSYKNGEIGKYKKFVEPGHFKRPLLLPKNLLKWEPSCQQSRPSM